eukprot:m.136870 g.136870  ORF g.136870 m.136870 type:complete len:485 (-) comp9912_c0_seq1:1795-3249(-)
MTTIENQGGGAAMPTQTPIDSPLFQPLMTDAFRELGTTAKMHSPSKSPVRSPITSPIKSPQRTPRGDRFIPDRTQMDFEGAHFSLMHETDENEVEEEAGHSVAADFERSMRANLMEGSHASRILAIKSPPASAPSSPVKLQDAMRQESPQQRKDRSVVRYISPNPDRILDAPELRDDFYLNVIDWSSTNIMAVALNDTVYLWNAGNGNISELCKRRAPGDYISSLSWVNDGSYLAIGTNRSEVQIWDVTRLKKLRTFRGHEGRVAAVCWNERTVTSGDKFGHIFNNDIRAQRSHLSSLFGHAQEVCGLKWSPDGKILASGGNDNVVNLWSTSWQKVHTLAQHTAAIKAIAWCPWQSNLLATGGGTQDRHIRFWNTTTGTCVNQIDTKSQVCSLIWNKQHREIVSGHGFSHNQLTIWKYPSLSKVAELHGHTNRVLAMACSPDGSTVVSAAGDETLRFWKCFASNSQLQHKKRLSTQSRLRGFIR